MALCYNKVFLISCDQCPLKFFMNFILQFHFQTCLYFAVCEGITDRLCGLVVRVLGYRSGGLGSIPGTTKKKN
jgi:hypothetical protein